MHAQKMPRSWPCHKGKYYCFDMFQPHKRRSRNDYATVKMFVSWYETEKYSSQPFLMTIPHPHSKLIHSKPWPLPWTKNHHLAWQLRNLRSLWTLWSNRWQAQSKRSLAFCVHIFTLKGFSLISFRMNKCLSKETVLSNWNLIWNGTTTV